jgi:hypothetical protein
LSDSYDGGGYNNLKNSGTGDDETLKLDRIYRPQFVRNIVERMHCQDDDLQQKYCKTWYWLIPLTR